MPKPTIGRTVHYALSDGQLRPATIVRVINDNQVDLSVFTNGDLDKANFPERVVMINSNTGADHHHVPALIVRHSVQLGDEPGQWRWPKVV